MRSPNASSAMEVIQAPERLRAELPALNIQRPERLALDPPAAMVSSSEVLGGRQDVLATNDHRDGRVRESHGRAHRKLALCRTGDYVSMRFRCRLTGLAAWLVPRG
jgi:hypothetical protein